MFAHFKNLKELMSRYSDDTVCRAYLEDIRWNGQAVCPHCNTPKKPYKLKDGKTYRCSSSTCRKDFTVTVGLVFENSKIPLSTWFAAIYLTTAHKKGISSCQLARDLGVTQKTAWFLNHRIREMFCNDVMPELNDTVEVDETYVGGKWQNMTKSKRIEYSKKGIDTKTPVMGMVQRKGKAGLKVIKAENTFKDFVHKHVNPNAVVVTDGHNSYRGLDESHYGHIIINHSEDEYVNGIYHTNTVEGLFSIFKRGIFGIYHHISPKHTQRYCEEFAYRYNSRHMKDCERFIMALKHSEGRLKYEELISNNPKKVA